MSDFENSFQEVSVLRTDFGDRLRASRPAHAEEGQPTSLGGASASDLYKLYLQQPRVIILT